VQVVRNIFDCKVLLDTAAIHLGSHDMKVEMRFFPLDSNQPENIKSFAPRKCRDTLIIDYGL